MRIAQINMMHVGSTGKIMLGIAETAASLGDETYTFSPYYYMKGQKPETPEIRNHFYFGSPRETFIHHVFAETTGLHGFGSVFGTKQLIRKMKEIRPDILHLHNLHNFTVNIPALFSYIKKENVRTVWTLHDCWAMTGKCPYFDLAECEKWKTGCYSCPALRDYPKAYMDRTRMMWKLKKKWFTGVGDMTLITPSRWLAEIVKESYLSEYPVRVIHNGIDLDVFRPAADSGTAEKYGIPEGKYIVLGVAFDWDKRKGLDVFRELAGQLPDSYRIVLVGTNDAIDRTLPDSVICIHRTQNQEELARLYSLADVLVNPTREDNFPTVNLEALACGTPVITFRTGGSPESIDETCGICVERGDTVATARSIASVCEGKPFTPEACRQRATQFEKHSCFMQYAELYREMNRTVSN